jgi:hypothetical protein
MHTLGTPSNSIWHGDSLVKDNLDGFWETLKNFDKREYKMMAASYGQGEVKNESGVVSGHAYSLIGIKEFENNG